MTLTPDQTTWLGQFAAVKAAGDAAAEAVEARRMAQAQIDEKLGDRRDEIRELWETQEIEVTPETRYERIMAVARGAETRRFLEEGTDDVDMLGAWHDAEDITAGLTSESGAALQKSLMEIDQIRLEMEAMTYGDPPQKVYTDPAQIAEDLYMPLVREGIIPESYVHDDYSEVARTFGAAAELYEERLQEHTQSMGTWDAFGEKFDTATTCIKLGFDISASIIEANAAVEALNTGTSAADLADNAEFKEAKEKAELLQLVGATVAAVGTGTKAAVKDKDVFKTLSSLTTVVTKIVTASAGKDTGTEVGAIMSAVIQTYPFGKRIKTWRETGKWDWSGAITDIGNSVSADIATGDGNSGKKFYANIGKAVKAGFEVIATGVEAIDMDDEERVLTAIASKIGAATTSISSAIVDIVKEKETEEELEAEKTKQGRDLTKEEAKAVKDKVSEEYETTLALLEEGENLDDISEKLAERQKVMIEAATEFDKSEKERILQASEDAQSAALKAYMDTPDPVFEAMLASGFGQEAYEEAPEDEEDEDLDPEAAAAKAQERAIILAEQEERRIKSLENLIALQKKHQATYELSKTIVSTAASVGKEALSGVIPGLGVAQVATQMIYAMLEAAKQGKEFLLWRANVQDARAAHTVQLDAIMNRHGLAEKQAIEAGITAALQAAKLVGEVLKLAGHAAPAGYAISAAASSGAALLEIASKAVTEKQMRDAWKAYKRAIDDPADRINARNALRANPTLAKYAMAYGAVIEGNAIAKEVMRRCGLNDTTLADPGANVSKVVEFLELKYKDDPIVLKASVSPKNWHPSATIELTGSSWCQFIFAAQNTKAEPKNKADPLLATSVDSTGVAGSFQAYETAVARVDAAVDDTEAKLAAITSAIAAGERLMTAFGRFNPVTAEDSPKRHQAVKDYADGLSAKCALQISVWTSEKGNLEAEALEAPLVDL